MTILVIEDESKTAKFLKKGLEEAGFVVSVAGDGIDGLHLAQELEFDLVILDVFSSFSNPSLSVQRIAKSLYCDRTQLIHTVRGAGYVLESGQ